MSIPILRRTRTSTLVPLALLLAVATACPAPKPQPTAPPPVAPAVEPAPKSTAPQAVPIALDSIIRTGKLKNGLTYYVRPHKKPEQRAQLWLAVNAGSVLEDDDQQGLAHFVEHMAFNGTKRFAKNELVDYLETIGTRFGPDLNAYTGFDKTVYMLKVPTDKPELVAKGLDILEDWAQGIAFSAEELEKERGVVLEEWRLGQGAFRRVFNKQLPIMFANSQYAKRLPIGKPEIIKGAPRKAFTRFYQDWYRPDLMAVVAVGDFDPEAMEAEIQRRFARLVNPATPRPRPRPEVPAHDDTLVASATDPELPFSRISIMHKLARRPETTDLDYRRSIAEDLVAQMLNARLQELAKTSDPPFIYASSRVGSSFAHPIETFSISARVKAGGAERALAALATELERVRRHGFTASELARAKAAELRQAERSAAEVDKEKSRELADEILRNFFEAESMPGRVAELAIVQRFLPEITLAELSGLPAKWIAQGSRVITASGPDKSPLPTDATLLAVLDKAQAAKEIAPYQDDAVAQSLVPAPPTPGTILRKETIPEIGVTVLSLSNGARVVFKPTDFKNDEIRLSAFSPGGHSLADDDKFWSAYHASAIARSAGAGAFSATQLRKALAGKSVSVGPYISELEEGLWGTASPRDLETLFQLIYLRMTAPRRDADAFAAWQAARKDWVTNRDSHPQQKFQGELWHFLASRHPRRKPLALADLEGVNPDDALAFYRDRFGDASDFTFLFVGNIEADKIETLSAQYLASLPTIARKEKWRDVGARYPKGVKRFEHTQGKESKSSVALVFHGKGKWSREAADDLAMLSEVLRIRLREVLREDMGGVYGVSAYGRFSRRPRPEYHYFVYFGCAPENVDKLQKAIHEVIASVQKKGVGDEYITKVKETRRRKRETDLKENRFWLWQLEKHFTYGTDPREILADEELIERVSATRVRAAARRFLSKKRYSVGVLMPEKQ